MKRSLAVVVVVTFSASLIFLTIVNDYDADDSIIAFFVVNDYGKKEIDFQTIKPTVYNFNAEIRLLLLLLSKKGNSSDYCVSSFSFSSRLLLLRMLHYLVSLGFRSQTGLITITISRVIWNYNIDRSIDRSV